MQLAWLVCQHDALLCLLYKVFKNTQMTNYISKQDTLTAMCYYMYQRMAHHRQ